VNELVPFKRHSQWKNPDIIYCSSPSQFQGELNILRYVARELTSVTGKCSSDDEDCGSFPDHTDYYSFSDAARYRSTAPEEDDELDGSGSGSGAGGSTVCEENNVSNDDEYKDDIKVENTLLSRSSSTSSPTFMFTLALTALMAALASL